MKVSFNARAFNKMTKDIVDAITEKLTDNVFADIKKNSPVRTGAFKRAWTKRGSGKKYRISNPKPYGPALEAGKSQQARDGVIRPAITNPRMIRR